MGITVESCYLLKREPHGTKPFRKKHASPYGPRQRRIATI